MRWSRFLKELRAQEPGFFGTARFSAAYFTMRAISVSLFLYEQYLVGEKLPHLNFLYGVALSLSIVTLAVILARAIGEMTNKP